MGTKFLLAVLMLGFSSVPALAAPVDSLFSDESVEIRADERLFTLMLLMNGMGWSEAAEYGPAPLKSPLYKGLRKDLIGKLAAYRERYVPNNVLNRAKRFVTEHPASMKDYIEACLHMSRAPEFKFQKTLPKTLNKLKGLDGLLRAAWKGARVGVLMSRYQEALVDGQQTLLSKVDERTKPLVMMLKAKTVKAADKPKAASSDDDMGDLFGGDDEDASDDGTATADDATAELESVAVTLSPLWTHGEMLSIHHNKRFEVVFGGSRGDGTTVAQIIALVRLRAAAGLASGPVSEAQHRAAWGLVAAATGRQGPDRLAPYPACVKAIADWRATKVPFTEGAFASELVKTCQVKGN